MHPVQGRGARPRAPRRSACEKAGAGTVLGVTYREASPNSLKFVREEKRALPLRARRRGRPRRGLRDPQASGDVRHRPRGSHRRDRARAGRRCDHGRRCSTGSSDETRWSSSSRCSPWRGRRRAGPGRAADPARHRGRGHVPDLQHRAERREQPAGRRAARRSSAASSRRASPRQQIKEALAAEYGRDALAVPKAEGFDVAATVVPIGVGVGALALLVILLPRWRRRDARHSEHARRRRAPPSPPRTPRGSMKSLRRFDR